MAIGVGALAALIVTIHVVEWVRGGRAWAIYRTQAEARGVEFSLEKLLPSSDVPAAQNFASLPLIDAGVKAKRGEGPQPTEFDLPEKAVAAIVGDGKPCDFSSLRSLLSDAQGIATDGASSDAEACAHAFSRFDAALNQLREGVQRPYARYARNLEHPENTGVPPFLLLCKAAQVLRLRFEAHAASGQLDAACDDFELVHGIARTLDESPVLVGAMIQVAITHIAVEGLQIWLQKAPWTSLQLARLDEAMAGRNLLRSFSRSLAVERAMLVHFGMRLVEGEDLTGFLQLIPVGSPAGFELLAEKANRLAWKLYPRGWHYQSLVWASPYYDECEQHLDVTGHRWLPGITNPRDRFNVGSFEGLRLAFAMIAVPDLLRAESRTVAVQAHFDMARVAIALERHRLAHGDYPDRLDALRAIVPALPHDLTDAKPLRYRPTADGHFLLYSLSFNRADDGGSPATDPKAPDIAPAFDRLDWVWAPSRTPAHTASR